MNLYGSNLNDSPKSGDYIVLEKSDGCLISLIKLSILILVIYIIYRASTAWIPDIYNNLEVYMYKTFSHIWWIILIISMALLVTRNILKRLEQSINFKSEISALRNMLFKTLIISITIMSIIFTTIFFLWLTFNPMGLGNVRYVKDIGTNHKQLTSKEINKGVNGSWIIGLQKSFSKEDKNIKAKTNKIAKEKVKTKTKTKSNKSKNNKSSQMVKKTDFFTSAKSFLDSEYKKAPTIIKIVLGFLYVILMFLWIIIACILYMVVILIPILAVAIFVKLFIFLINKVIDLFIDGRMLSMWNRQ